MPTPWSNWSGSVTCWPQASETPTNEAGLVALVNQARAGGRAIRVAGSGHSFVPLYGRETVTISIHQAHDLPYQPFFADAEAIFRHHRGRPHWGKIHRQIAQALRDLYPRWDNFHQVRQRLDPEGRFLNEYLRALLVIGD